MLTIKVVKGSWQKIDNWSGSGTQSWDITVEPGRGGWHIQYVCPEKTVADEADLSGSKRWQVDTIGQVKDNGAMQNSGYYPLTAADTGEGHGGETSTYNVTWKWVSSGGVFDAYSPSKGLMTIQGDLTTRVDAKIPTQPPTTDYGYAAALSVASSTLCGVITSAVSTAAPNVEVWEPKAPVDNAVSLTETVVGGQVNRSYSLRAFGSTNISGPGGAGSRCNYDSVAFVSTNVQKYLPSSQ
jgi:hypothetical protein